MNAFTYKQLKQINATGRIKYIYYSPTTRWWTHDPADLKEASEIGQQKQVARANELIADPNTPDEKKGLAKMILEMIESGKSKVPCDPAGTPLMMAANVDVWINSAADKPEFFGKHGLDAFMKAHHKNSGGLAWEKWDDVNKAIDEELAAKSN